MKKIKKGFILPSAAYTVPRNRIIYRDVIDKKPEVGDLVYGSINLILQHKSLENKEGRIHGINEGTKSIFVIGTRYAPDYYEGVVPSELSGGMDLIARSGIISQMRIKNTNVNDCTRVKVYGYVCDKEGKVINTRDYAKPWSPYARLPRSKMILVVGTSMNSGKSQAAASCCWALNTMGHKVTAAKATGTASLKDILLMEDSGAQYVCDFTSLGYPSTYLTPENELLDIFKALDHRISSYKPDYVVVELADGILQKETRYLISTDYVQKRIHRLVFCAHDAFGVLSGLNLLKSEASLVPDAISGVISSSPLGLSEMKEFHDIVHFDSKKPDLHQMAQILV